MGELLSPVEAILQNILGADNILVPPGSQVEEILQAIYYNTEYEKNPKSRVAEILLAIKNKGVYDGPVLSRVEDILIHKLNNIPYTKHKKEDLSRVEQLLLDWLEQGGGEEIIEYTGTFPMTILANGEPLLDYLISGNTTQSGTPTPDNPVMPQGTGERTAQLFDKDNTTLYNLFPGTENTIRASSNARSIAIPCVGGETYTVSKKAGQIFMVCFTTEPIATQVTYTELTTNNTATSITVVSPLEAKYLFVYFYNSTADVDTVETLVNSIMINTGLPALPYDKFGYKIPISSASTTTPVYLGEVETTRWIKKLVLTGQESGFVSIDITNHIHSIRGIFNSEPELMQVGGVCTHYKYNNAVSSLATNMQNGDFVLNKIVNDYSFTIEDNSFNTADDFKSYLAQQYAAGTPVTVWYVLANEETAVVNEPLMKIGDYADTLSMEQAGVDVPTNKKPTETVIDVSTLVKPSEGYIKYTEPTDGPAPKTQVLGTKDREIYMTSNDEVYVLRR